jgi:hypothetical protein
MLKKLLGTDLMLRKISLYISLPVLFVFAVNIMSNLIYSDRLREDAVLSYTQMFDGVSAHINQSLHRSSARQTYFR